MYFLIAVFIVTFAILAQYRVRHSNQPILDWLKSWFK